jgi:polyisoprenoid-binding protein YceI
MFRKLTVVLFILMLTLAACGDNAAPPTAEPVVAAPTNTPLPEPTATEVIVEPTEEAMAEADTQDADEAMDDESMAEADTQDADEAMDDESMAEADTQDADEAMDDESMVVETDAHDADDTMEDESMEEADEGMAHTDDVDDVDEAMDEAASDDADNAMEEEPMAAAAELRTFVIVPEQTTAAYIVAEEFFGGALDRLGIEQGLVDTIGSTQEVTGEMVLDLANLQNPVVSSQFTVNLNTLTSDQSRRDNRIKEANLESNTFPLAEFTINSIENSPASYSEGDEVVFQAQGEITIREITQPATFAVTTQMVGNTITGAAEARLKMTDFGVEPPNFANMFSVEDEFTVRVEFTFKEQ